MPKAQLRFHIPEERRGGVYSNFVTAWHTAHEFTLDFGVTDVPTPAPADADADVVQPVRVVARIKIPPSLVFSILRTINENMTRYEQRFGEIRQPGEQPPLQYPDDLAPGEGETSEGG